MVEYRFVCFPVRKGEGGMSEGVVGVGSREKWAGNDKNGTETETMNERRKGVKNKKKTRTKGTNNKKQTEKGGGTKKKRKKRNEEGRERSEEGKEEEPPNVAKIFWDKCQVTEKEHKKFVAMAMVLV